MASPDQIDLVAESKPQQSNLAKKWSGFVQFLYNPVEKSVLGRTAGSWARIGIFYLFFYSGLAGFFGSMLAIFFVTINRDKPTYIDDSSLLKGNPGLGFRPMPNYETTLIRFIKGTPSTYTDYTDQIQTFLTPYKGDQSSSNTETYTCYGSSIGSSKQADKDGYCAFSLNEYFGNKVCTETDSYGYEKGKPCVILKLNKIYGWEPEVYFNSSYLPEAAQRLNVEVAPNGTRQASMGSVGVSCEGINPADKENIGTVKITPSYGFPANFFPYMNQNGYRQPLVAVTFEGLTNGVLVMVRCRVWAKNIQNDDFNSKEGAVHFEILID